VQPVLNVATAFTAGLVSFVSPCVLPLIPAYLSFLTGSSLQELREESPHARARIISHACVFSLGFSTVFVLAGLAAGSLGGVLGQERALIARIGGVLIVLFGLNMLGVFRIDSLFVDRRLRIGTMRRSFFASFLIGVGFAAGWSPCIGPILAGILVLASTQGSGDAALLLSAYSLGLAVPLIATACCVGAALPLLDRIKPKLRVIEATAGAILIAGGVVLFTGSFSQVAAFFARFVPSP
jgi:cytochrome c-type biogenesis protein